MEALQSITELKILTVKVNYDKKSKVLAIDLPGFTFIGNYTKNTRISVILNDIHKVLEEKGIKIERENIDFIDHNTQENVHGNTKLKNLMKLKEFHAQMPEKKPVEKKVSKAKPKKKARAEMSTPKPVAETSSLLSEITMEPMEEMEEEYDMKKTEDEDIFFSAAERANTGAMVKEKEIEVDEVEESEKVLYKMKEEVDKKDLAPPPPPAEGRGGGATPPAPKAPPPSAPGGPPPTPAPSSAPARKKAKMVRALDDEVISDNSITLKDEAKEIEYDKTSNARASKETEYNINMGLQYYNVMMEKKSYLFYVYFSHKELKITDEEGKTVYTTTIKIVTKKKEPPVMDLRIEGDGFEVHPLSGRVEVKKNAVNPPLMIFSVMPLKRGKLKKKGESERRFLNVLVEFEGNIVSHSILSIIVQPKFFKVNLGPLSFNINKGTAIAISIGSIIITVLLLLYTILNFDITDITGVDIITGIVPSIGSLIFVLLFVYTLIKGVYPLKQQFQGLLNFDGGGIEK